MARTPKAWTAKQAHTYSDKNAISKFLVKRKLPVPTPINKWGRRRPKQMRGQKKKKPPTICVDRDSGIGDHHEVQSCLHGHRRSHFSTEKTKRSLTDDNVDGGIKYRRDGS